MNNVCAGTLPVPLIVGFGEACAIAAEQLETESQFIRARATGCLTGCAHGWTAST